MQIHHQTNILQGNALENVELSKNKKVDLLVVFSVNIYYLAPLIFRLETGFCDSSQALTPISAILRGQASFSKHNYVLSLYKTVMQVYWQHIKYSMYSVLHGVSMLSITVMLWYTKFLVLLLM